jgi:hypothetical protein
MMRAIEFILALAGLYATFRGWIWICDHVLLKERRGELGLPCDGTPLTEDEYEAWQQIEQGYEQTAEKPGELR